ncbi:MAG: hypothetical protein RL540_730 [Actinomycetota bacterium]
MDGAEEALVVGFGSDGEEDGEGLTDAALLQINFRPERTQTYFLPSIMRVTPFFVHVVPDLIWAECD